VLSGNAHLPLKSLMGQPVLLQLQSSAGVGVFEPWHGHVTQAALLGSDGGLARYRLVVQPWLAFLEHRQDSFVFNSMSVVQIIESVFADYAGQGTLRPQWRWHLLDPSVYAQRSLCIQYQESDLAFVQRLLREEGLFCFWECTGASGSSVDAGSHTLVIADHNGAFPANREPVVRFAQGGPTLNADALWRIRDGSQLQATQFALASPDYRRVALREVQQTGQLGNTGAPEVLSGLGIFDMPGAYAYETEDQGQRLLTRQAEAVDALRISISAEGGWRAARAGTHCMVQDNPRMHPRQGRGGDPARPAQRPQQPARRPQSRGGQPTGCHSQRQGRCGRRGAAQPAPRRRPRQR
jgi:type VI secretion system secreted protein VgrG